MFLYKLNLPKSSGSTVVSLPVVTIQAAQLERQAVALFISNGLQQSFEDVFSESPNIKHEDLSPVRASSLNKPVCCTSNKITSTSRESGWLDHAKFDRTGKVGTKVDMDPNFYQISRMPAGSISTGPEPSTISKPESSASISNYESRYSQVRVKLQDGLYFWYILQTSTAVTRAPPDDAIRTLQVNDIFVHRVLPRTDSPAGRQIQVWAVVQSDTDKGSQSRSWQHAKIGKMTIMEGVERYLGVDTSSGKPFWYLEASFSKYSQREKKRLQDAQASERK